MKKKHQLLFISYFFFNEDGVGALRSKSLVTFLERNGYVIKVLNKNTFGSIGKRIFGIWIILCTLKVLVSKQKEVYISCGPFNHLLLVSLACFFRRKKLIVDFRDPWSINIKTSYGKTNGESNRYKEIISVIIEKIVYNLCTYFIVCTNGMKLYYSGLFRNKKKIRIIKNGYDFNLESLEKHINKDIKQNQILKFVCLGKFAEYDYEKANKVLLKIKEFEKKGNRIHITFIGTERETTYPILKRYSLESCSTFYERMVYEEALKIAINCNIAILIIRNEGIDFGTKIFDYIGLGLQVLDTFDHTQNFYKEFKDIMSLSNSIEEIPKDIRTLYSRENSFKEFLELLC